MTEKKSAILMDSDQQGLLVQDKTRNNNNNMVSSSSATEFCYSDDVPSNNQIQNHLMNQIQTFSRAVQVQTEIFNNLTPGNMESFFTATTSASNHHGNNIPSSSSKPSSFYHGDNNNEDEDDGEGDDENENDHRNGLMESMVTGHHEPSASWHHHVNNRYYNDNNNSNIVDDSSLPCVFTCEGNERPSQGLSLSLSSTNPSSIGLQSFELRQHQQHHSPMLLQDHQQQHHQQQDFRYVSRDGFYGKSHVNMNQNHQQQEHQLGHHQFHLRHSKFLGPAQELLNEFCCLGTKQNELPIPANNKPSTKNNNQWPEQDDQRGSSKKEKIHLSPHELNELQKRKSKLLSMLDEVDKRYKHYCDQMKAVVSSFEAVAGNGAAKVYSALASKAMSRHFRCLRDGIVGQIQEANKAMGEKDTASVVAPGTTKGETPRLRLLDQSLRQQRAIQQMSLMESHPWRPQRGLPERSVSVLRAWLFEHFLHPYPSDVDKQILARQTGLSRSQVSNWFINARVRLWKPMVEEMYVEETKDPHLPVNDNNLLSSDFHAALISDDFRPCQDPHHNDQKPTPGQLLRIDSECLSSIISPNSDPKHDHSRSNTALQHHHHQNQITFGRVATDSYMGGGGGGMELDFASYNHHNAGHNNSIGYDNGSTSGGHHHFGSVSTGGGVSLTLGLQQHGGSNNFGLGSHQETMFYPRDHHNNMIDDSTQTVPYSILDGEGQNLPYRNLLGAQLLHDLAG